MCNHKIRINITRCLKYSTVRHEIGQYSNHAIQGDYILEEMIALGLAFFLYIVYLFFYNIWNNIQFISDESSA